MQTVTISIPPPGASDVAQREFHLKLNGAEQAVQLLPYTGIAGPTPTAASFNAEAGVTAECWDIDIDGAGNRSPESPHLTFTVVDSTAPPAPGIPVLLSTVQV